MKSPALNSKKAYKKETEIEDRCLQNPNSASRVGIQPNLSKPTSSEIKTELAERLRIAIQFADDHINDSEETCPEKPIEDILSYLQKDHDGSDSLRSRIRPLSGDTVKAVLDERKIAVGNSKEKQLCVQVVQGLSEVLVGEVVGQLADDFDVLCNTIVDRLLWHETKTSKADFV